VLRGKNSFVRAVPVPVRALCGLALMAVFCLPGIGVHPASGLDETAEKIIPSDVPAGKTGLDKTWTGDFDQMVARNRIRVLVPYNKAYYFLDRGRQLGLAYEMLTAFQKQLNRDLKRRTVKVEVVFVPVSRDELIQGLVSGRGDIAVGNLTITPERERLVDFSAPLLTGVSEILVTSTEAPAPGRLEDLSGRSIHLRPSSSYYTSLQRLNDTFAAKGLARVRIIDADENLEDSDLLEMVNAGLLPMAIVDDHKARFWAKIFKEIRLHPDVAVNRGGKIGWAFRKDSPKLKEAVNRFIEKNKKGTLLGNILFNKYLEDTRYVRKALAPGEIEKFNSTIDLLRKYAGQYGVDWLLVGALGYQESSLDQSKRSGVGAIGVMQLMPSTARDPVVGISNIEELEPNIHAGVKYLQFLHSNYFLQPDVDPVNQWLFAVAAYNAGPAKIAKLRLEARGTGLDPNKWFRNVELVAARRIGRETVQYVSNIYKYHIAYKLVLESRAKRDDAQSAQTENSQATGEQE